MAREHGTNISFGLIGTSPSGKTRVWEVVNRRDGSSIGTVRWFGRWRCYSFHPDANTVFEKVCLRDIADFCDRKTAEHLS